jgi:uncharacterized protein YdhG (YjbR/CyaY superfamily)
VDAAAREYIDAIDDRHRPLFDRIHRLVLEEHPEAEVILSYKMPTFTVGRRRLYVGVWRHGLSLYGWEEGRDGGFVARHPDLTSGKGTIRLRPADAAAIGDDELRSLVRGALTS